MQRGRHLLILRRNAAEFSGPEVIWDGLKDTGNVFSGQMSPYFSLYFGKNGHWILRAKDEKDHWDGYQRNQPLWWYGDASVLTAWVICIHVKVPLMHRLMLEIWRDVCCRQDSDFSQELLVYFSRTMPGLILQELKQRGFVGIECVCLNGMPAVEICLLLKMYWNINSTGKTATIFSSLTIINVIKRKGNVTQW